MDASHLASPGEVMERTLELIGEADVDIVPRYFERFHAAFPDQAERFCNRASSEGLMVNEMLAMLLAQAADEAWLPMMMRAQVNTHHDHGDIALAQYEASLAMLVDVLAEAAGPGWDAAQERVWRGAASALFALITCCY